MKNTFLILLFAFISCLPAHAVLQAQLAYATFFSPNSGPYVEIYFSFNASNVKYVPTENGYRGEIAIRYHFIKGADTTKTEDYIVQSPVVTDTTKERIPFIIQHRIPLENGEYDMNISIRDMHTKDKALETTQPIKLRFSKEVLALSDIELYHSSTPNRDESIFAKNGFRIIPYTSDIIPASINEIGFYAELYNADIELGKDSALLITYYIENLDNGELVSNFRGFSRKKAAQVNVIMGKFLIQDLPTGNYNVKIDVLNRDNQLLAAKSISFHKQSQASLEQEQMLNSFVDRYENIDSLSQHIKYLQPIADRLEWEFAENQLNGKDFLMMKKFFYNFWEKRNPIEPEYEWLEYLRQVRIVNANYKTPFQPGYLSDRGYRYLKYGPPTFIFESFDEPTAYPYEVWSYNQVRNQNNKTIVFCNKSQVMNDYSIIHSDIRGEIYNKDWNLIINRQRPGVTDDENPVHRDQFGGTTDDWIRGVR